MTYKVKIEIKSSKTKSTYKYESTERTKEEAGIFIDECAKDFEKAEKAALAILEK